MARIALHTFGCKINQYESQGMGTLLLRAGHDLVGADEAAEVHVINTCTVTAPSDASCRQLIRRLTREQPRARVIVTGCYAQREGEAIARMNGVSLVMGHGEKGRVDDHVATLLREAPAGEHPGGAPIAGAAARALIAFDETPVTHFAGRTRATVKVQDGCDKACGFCVIPSVRGGSRSRTTDATLDEASRLIDAGYLEIVLTGIHLGSWRDPQTNERLDTLVQRLLALRGLRRLRLSSLEPQHLTDRLLALADSPAFMPFFHLPLQAGDDGVLRSMRRAYNTRQFAERVERLVARRPEVGIGTDLLAGYPGEDSAAFERGYRFVEAMPFSLLHVFTFSPRPGTEAAAMNRAPADRSEILERSARLRALGRAKAAAFHARFAGSRAEILVEAKETREGRLTGLTGNYIRAELPKQAHLRNRIVSAMLYEGPRMMVAVPEAA